MLVVWSAETVIPQIGSLAISVISLNGDVFQALVVGHDDHTSAVFCGGCLSSRPMS
jgi:hypothetical protein